MFVRTMRLGMMRLAGLTEGWPIGIWFSVIAGPPSRGSPVPVKARPRRASEKGTFIVSPRKRTEASVSTPRAPAKIWSVTFGPSSLMTCASDVPAREWTSAISLYFTPSARSVAMEPESASMRW